MKLCKTFKRFSSLFLISLLVLSLMSCAKKDESDKDKKEDKKQETTTDKQLTDLDSLFDAVNSNCSINISENDIMAIIEDNYITYNEIQSIIKAFPSFSVELSGILDADFDVNVENETESEDLSFNFDFLFEYDSKTQSLHLGGETTSSMSYENENFDLWLINEDGTYYGYETYDDETYREELGSLKDAFGDEGISIEEFMGEYDSMVNDYSILFDSIKEIDNDKIISEYRKMYTLKQGTVNYDGNECYNLLMTLDLYDIFNKVKESDQLKDALENMNVDSDMDALDEYLDEELFGGFTINDIIKLVKFDVNYYISTDFNYYAINCDGTKCVNDLLDVVEEYMLFYYDTADVQVNLNCNELSVEVKCKLNSDINVTFEGEYQED